MKVDVTVPELAESISEAIMGEWVKKPGEFVQEGELLVDIETDKVILEITAPQSGQLTSISKHKDEQVTSNEVIAAIDTTKQASAPKAQAAESPSNPQANSSVNSASTTASVAALKPEVMPAAVTSPVQPSIANSTSSKTSPAVRKLAVENNIDVQDIHGSGKDGRITKHDIEEYIQAIKPASASELDAATEILAIPQFASDEGREDKRVPMTGLRRSIAKRLVNTQQQSAILTTFNEVNMTSVMDLRKRFKEGFEEAHGVKLGFMSFFIKAAVEALKEFPVINASVEGDDIIYHDYFDVGIAVSTQRGLIVPVIKNADDLSFSGIEKTINDFVLRARENKVTIEELTGGTFTITNGGVFGSMLSTPIINSPQSAILGMHSIQARPIAQNGEVVIAPMMYLALSYDHRIIDGKEAVQFLVHIKNIIEDPNRLLLQV